MDDLTQEQLDTIRYKTRRLSKDDPIGLVQMLNEAYRLGQQNAEEMRRDAERYRWLREQSPMRSDTTIYVARSNYRRGVYIGGDNPNRDELDAAIDAAMEPKP